ncbi:MAG TPA: radical SAM protein [Acidimicrobiales bacterium]|nr:radical SAM protein [Acidimicrobiales bacterium]
MRWSTVGEDEPDSTLFDPDLLADRHVGRGEWRGLEFLHVNARKIINEVPASSRMPFRYTINAYRGCSHACVYCLAGDTPILMADGQTKALADVRAGDLVYGTVRRGGGRRFEPTVVQDHWSTVKAAWRVTLADGATLVASGDHRFLTQRGWEYVKALSPDDELIGPGSLGSEPAPAGYRRLQAVEPLDVDLPMFDITTGTGDFIANGVVSHNCFARPTHDYLGLGIGEDFERKIVVKINAVERLKAELAASRWAGHHIAMGTNTDPYQRCEGKYHLTQGIVRALGEAANPFSILTKSTLILRDLDLLVAAAGRADVRVNLSIGTLDDEVWHLTEPGTPRPRARVEAVRKLNQAGIPCGVLVAPVLPGLSDRDDQLREVVEACVDAGAVTISTVALHLRPGVKDHYLGWLRDVRPDLADATSARYRSSYLPKADQQALSDRVRTLVEEARRRRIAPRTSTTPPGTWRSPKAARTIPATARAADRVRLHMGGDAPRPVPSPPPGEQLTLGW